jgi:hypothetical protein
VKGSGSFLKKRTKKLLSVVLRAMPGRAPHQMNKSLFASFSSEKEVLAFLWIISCEATSA